MSHPTITRFATLALFVAPAFAATAPTVEVVKKSMPEPVEFVTTPTMQNETRATVWALSNQHILHENIRDMKMEEIIADYATKLDPARLFFLDADIRDAQSRHGIMLDVWLQSGNLSAAFDMYNTLGKRVRTRVDKITARLDQPFDFTSEEKFVPIRTKADWAKNETESDKLWEQRLKADLLVEILGARDEGDDADAPADGKQPAPPPERITPEKLSAAVAKIKKRYANIRHYLELDAGEVEEIFLNTLAGRYDPHTTFFSKQSLEEFDIMIRNSLCGIGAQLRDEDGYCVVKEILPGGPLEKNGRVKPGDRIIGVATGDTEMKDIVGMRLNKIVQLLRGKRATPITLRIETGLGGEHYTLHLMRDEIKLTTQLADARVVELPGPDGKTTPIGVIRLPAFYGKAGEDGGDAASTTDNVSELIAKLKKHSVRAIVMDLRTNGGGLLDEAVRLTGLFITNGPVLQVKDGDGRIAHLDDENPSVTWGGPLVVLVSKLSASASEIFAGALQDHRRALIVGDEHTHGKGSVQSIFPYSRFQFKPELGSAVKITIQKWYLPGGNSIQLKGVASDIVVPSVFSVLPVAESDLPGALAWDRITGVLDENTPAGPDVKVRITQDLVARLREASGKRKSTMPEFLSLNRSIARTADKVNEKQQSLNFVERRKERLDDLAFNRALKSDIVKLAEESGYKQIDEKLDAALAQEKKTPGPAKPDKSLSLLANADTADWPEFDVQLREALRIAQDWAALPAPIETKPVAADTRTVKTSAN